MNSSPTPPTSESYPPRLATLAYPPSNHSLINNSISPYINPLEPIRYYTIKLPSCQDKSYITHKINLFYTIMQKRLDFTSEMWYNVCIGYGSLVYYYRMTLTQWQLPQDSEHKLSTIRSQLSSSAGLLVTPHVVRW